MGPGTMPGAGAAHPDLAAFVAALAADGPFVAHEVLEAAWRRPGDILFRQGAAQALIQVCASYVQRSRGNAHGARLLVARAALRLAGPADGAVEAALAGVGIERAALSARLSSLPDETERWPDVLDLIAPGRRGTAQEPAPNV